MCGRFTMATPGNTIAEIFELAEVPQLAPRYNIAPTQAVAAVRVDTAGRRELAMLHWGLIPSWAKEAAMGVRMINARAETLAEKPAFRVPFRQRRCLIVADGFFEWRKLEVHKQPYFICLRDRSPFAFAGLWEHWAPPGVEAVESCTIITTTPNELVEPLHDRMPAILGRDDYERWLDPTSRETERLQTLLRPYPGSLMMVHSVGLRINNPGFDDPSCIAPA
jgi:putative SOS response-associated peptidase YedK